MKVFCSHRSTEKLLVEKFAEQLRTDGIEPWYDEWEIRAGDSFISRINEGLLTCNVGLVFLSGNA